MVKVTPGWSQGRWCVQPAADPRSPGGSCPSSTAGVWRVLNCAEVAVPSSVKWGGSGSLRHHIMAGGKCHAHWPLPCPASSMSPLTSATGTPSGGRHCRRTSWSRGTSLPRGSWSKFLRRSGKREGTRHSLEAAVPHSSHEVAVHTKGTIVGTPGFYLGNSLSSNGGPDQVELWKQFPPHGLEWRGS